MILTLLGWFYIITGVLFLLQPERMRNKFRKMSLKKLRRICFALALIIGLLLIKSTWGVDGFLAKLFLVFGFIALFKALFYLKSQAAEKVLEWWLNKDISFFRMTAILQIAVGGLLLSI